MLRAGLLLILLPGLLRAQTPVNLRSPAPGNATIVAAFNAGRVTISTWSHDSIAISGFFSGAKVSLRTSGDSLIVQHPQGEADLTIQIPQRSALAVRSMTAGVTLTGSLSGASLRSTSGQLRIAGEIPQLSAHTVTGQIHINAATLRLDASSFTGQLIYRAMVQPNLLTLQNHSGQIVVILPRSIQVPVVAATIHGRVIDERRSAAATGAPIKARTFTGHILIREEP